MRVIPLFLFCFNMFLSLKQVSLIISLDVGKLMFPCNDLFRLFEFSSPYLNSCVVCLFQAYIEEYWLPVDPCFWFDF